jgi:hypothetical protein
MATLAETMAPLFAVQPGAPAVESDADKSIRADKYSASVFAAIAGDSEVAEVVRLAAIAAAAAANGLTHPEALGAWRIEVAVDPVDGDVETAVLAYMEAAGLMPFAE